MLIVEFSGDGSGCQRYDRLNCNSLNMLKWSQTKGNADEHKIFSIGIATASADSLDTISGVSQKHTSKCKPTDLRIGFGNSY